ncbi:hypothetical protein KI387_017527, partial [Taxus chinensis]
MEGKLGELAWEEGQWCAMWEELGGHVEGIWVVDGSKRKDCEVVQCRDEERVDRGWGCVESKNVRRGNGWMWRLGRSVCMEGVGRMVGGVGELGWLDRKLG